MCCGGWGARRISWGATDFIDTALASVRESLRRTMTFDNGKEFAEHETLSTATDLASYFAHLYAAWQRGTNEHANGLERRSDKGRRRSGGHKGVMDEWH